MPRSSQSLDQSLSRPLRRPLRIALVCATAALVFPAMPAFSQSTANPSTGTAAAQSSTSTQPEASQSGNGSGETLTPKQQRSARKANAKAAHAQRKAELSKLEKQGYKPTATEPNYPDNIQNAEKKANGQ